MPSSSGAGDAAAEIGLDVFDAGHAHARRGNAAHRGAHAPAVAPQLLEHAPAEESGAAGDQDGAARRIGRGQGPRACFQRDPRDFVGARLGGRELRCDLLADGHGIQDAAPADGRRAAVTHAGIEHGEQLAEAGITLLPAEQQAPDAGDAAPELLRRLAEGLDHHGRSRSSRAERVDHVAEDEIRL